jgi:kynurenine formamidase
MMKRRVQVGISVACGLALVGGVGQFAWAAGQRKGHASATAPSAQQRATGQASSRDREERDRGEGRVKEIQFKSVVDLSHVIDTNIPLWPGDPAVVFNKVADINADGYYLRSFTIGEHSATHMNAGNSFFAGGSSIDSYGPEKLVRRAVVVDVRGKVNRNLDAAGNSDYVVTTQDFKDWERANGRIPKDSIVFVLTGWQDRWNDQAKFISNEAVGDAPYDLHFPGIGGDASAWLLAERNIAGVGIDTHGADPGQDANYQTNNNVLAADGIVLECVANLDKLKPTGNTVVLGRLALKEGSGTPLSVLAFTN